MRIHGFNKIVFGDVCTYLKWKYGNDPAYANAVVVLGYNVANCSIGELRQKYPGYRVVVYNLEQLFPGSKWVNDKSRAWWDDADELWDYDRDNILFLQERGYDPKYVPMSYCPLLATVPDAEKDIDVLFYGSLTKRRAYAMARWINKSEFSYHTAIIAGVTGDRLDNYIARSKVIVNIHAFEENSRQEQVRLFKLVANRCCVVSERSPINYMGNSIVECDIDKLNDCLWELLDSGRWKDIAEHASERYSSIDQQ